MSATRPFNWHGAGSAINRTAALSQWFRTRFGGRRLVAYRIGIVALARRLLIALWRYVTLGQVPEGALLKA